MADKKSNVLGFKLEREGFPINIGSTEFFFGTSAEDLQRFFTVQDEMQEELKRIETEYADVLKTDEISEEIAIKSLEFQKEIARVQYDAALGKGSFERIYNEFPYADVLLQNFADIEFAIAERLEQETVKRVDNYSKQKVNLMKKKALKNKKKKK